MRQRNMVRGDRSLPLAKKKCSRGPPISPPLQKWNLLDGREVLTLLYIVRFKYKEEVYSNIIFLIC